jgi:hypothetical protein
MLPPSVTIKRGKRRKMNQLERAHQKLPSAQNTRIVRDRQRAQSVSFLQNRLTDIVAIDMFVVATATFRLLYALIVQCAPSAGGAGRICAVEERRRLEHEDERLPKRARAQKPNAKQLELKCIASARPRLRPACKLYIGNPYQACLLEWWF